MPIYDEYVPRNIVYSFKEDCEKGNFDKLNSFFPTGIINNTKPNIYKK
jgi:hypothetical protein